MLKRYDFAREDEPGAVWLARFQAGRAQAEAWYLGAGDAAPPVAAACRAALERHMPELLPAYDRACALVGQDALARCILSHYRPADERAGCSQAIWLGRGGPALVRNYDYPLDLVTGRFEATCWSGRRVIAKAQRPWGGCIDGMNEDGLVASLTFGGNTARGEGFSVILMLRYVLETCTRVGEAADALCRIPIATTQNVMLLDRSGAHATLYLGPHRSPAVTDALVCTNHQETPGDVADSLPRHQCIAERLARTDLTLEQFAAGFLEAPLLSRSAASTTAYTAIYRPATGHVDYLWPGERRVQSFETFVEGSYTHDYGVLS